ncbi:MAG: ATP-binding protein, partial [Thermodesulfobacteriota bacterium]
FQIRNMGSLFSIPLLILYGLVIIIFILSVSYALLIKQVRNLTSFAKIQIGIDTLVVSSIIFMTGGFSSIFPFLYLLVIIYSAMLLSRRETMIIASLCSIQYGLMVSLEYNKILGPVGFELGFYARNYSELYVFYKVFITMSACFAVAFLSGVLSERERKTKQEMRAMETYLKRVEKMAIVGEMAAGLAHEIKNPLASLIGSIQMIRDEKPFGPMKERLMQIIQREADRLSSLVNHFLIFARPPAGRPVPIHLAKNLSEIIEFFEKDEICNSRITIEKEMIGGAWIEMDPGHLRQVIWNLLLNAAESIEGKGKIHIQIKPDKNQMVEIAVSDTGCGISEEKMKSIFDPFFTTKAKGSGLGLSIVHRILESYGYLLSVRSRVGEGSTFTIRTKRIDPPKTESEGSSGGRVV